MGSAAVAAWFAHVTYWILVAFGCVTGTLTMTRAIIVVLLWIAGAVALPYAPYLPARSMFPSYVAVLDIALVLLIVKGDVRLT